MSLFDHVDGNSRRYLQRLKDEGVVEKLYPDSKARFGDVEYFVADAEVCGL